MQSYYSWTPRQRAAAAQQNTKQTQQPMNFYRPTPINVDMANNVLSRGTRLDSAPTAFNGFYLNSVTIRLASVKCCLIAVRATSRWRISINRCDVDRLLLKSGKFRGKLSEQTSELSLLHYHLVHSTAVYSSDPPPPPPLQRGKLRRVLFSPSRSMTALESTVRSIVRPPNYIEYFYVCGWSAIPAQCTFYRSTSRWRSPDEFFDICGPDANGMASWNEVWSRERVSGRRTRSLQCIRCLVTHDNVPLALSAAYRSPRGEFSSCCNFNKVIVMRNELYSGWSIVSYWSADLLSSAIHGLSLYVQKARSFVVPKYVSNSFILSCQFFPTDIKLYISMVHSSIELRQQFFCDNEKSDMSSNLFNFFINI